MRRLSRMCPLLVLLSVGSAGAQTVYVGGAIGAEVALASSTRSGGTTYDGGSGETFSGALRVGTGLSDTFGLELEYVRPGRIDANVGGLVYAGVVDPLVPGATGGAVGPGLTVPSIIGQSTQLRTSTIGALLTARQRLGNRADLVYLGGVGFSRVVRETEFNVPRGVRAGALVPFPSTTTTQYAAGPLVGLEVRASMTGHARLVAGVRLHVPGQSVVDGWIVRPSVGLAWAF